MHSRAPVLQYLFHSHENDVTGNERSSLPHAVCSSLACFPNVFIRIVQHFLLAFPFFLLFPNGTIGFGHVCTENPAAGSRVYYFSVRLL